MPATRATIVGRRPVATTARALDTRTLTSSPARVPPRPPTHRSASQGPLEVADPLLRFSQLRLGRISATVSGSSRAQPCRLRTADPPLAIERLGAPRLAAHVPHPAIATDAGEDDLELCSGVNVRYLRFSLTFLLRGSRATMPQALRLAQPTTRCRGPRQPMPGTDCGAAPKTKSSSTCLPARGRDHAATSLASVSSSSAWCRRGCSHRQPVLGDPGLLVLVSTCRCKRRISLRSR